MSEAAANTSTSSVLNAFILNLVIFGAFLLGFVLLRLKFHRIYSPKSSYDVVGEDEKPPLLPNGPVQWIWPLFRIKSSFVIKYGGLDGYFFLRYIKVIGSFFFGSILLLIILLPINSTNGLNNEGFDLLSISNIRNKNRYYCHVFMSWILYGCFLFVVYRELYFYNSVRLAALSSPYYAKKVASKTVIFQTVPEQFLDEKEFFKLFLGVTKIWVARGQRSLAKKVQKRKDLAFKLEGALTALLKKAVKAKVEADKEQRVIEPANEVVCYVPQKKRPSHRLRPLIGEKVDTIEYCRAEIPKLDKEVQELQRNFKSAKPMNTIAVEFESQYYAQLAYQTTVHHSPLQFTPKFIGVEPQDLKWINMRMFWWERRIRSFGAAAAIAGVVLLWAFPVAFVGVISNVNSLTQEFPALRFIYRLPKVIRGVITSLLPTILLAVLMMLLPIFIRTMARVAGAPSNQHIEHFTQQAFFAFQVIQVFLVTTLASSATSAVTQIVQNPSSAMNLLASRLPRSSNFYISYITLQGLTITGGALFQVVSFIMFYALSFILDTTVRKKHDRWYNLGTYDWGTMFPVYSNLAVIVLSYGVISPLILPFATLAFFLIYMGFKYNICYVNAKAHDGRGLFYPTALFQTMCGVYFGEICLLGLFVVGRGWGPIVLEAILIGVTAFVHVNMNISFDHLLQVVPTDVMKPLDGYSETPSFLAVPGSKSLEEGSSEDEKSTGMVPLLADGAFAEKSFKSTNFVMRFLQPWLYCSFTEAKSLLPSSYAEEEEVDPTAEEHFYDYPDVLTQMPCLWIPADAMGLSKVEIERFRGIIDISDEGASFDAKGKIHWTGHPPSSGELMEKLEKLEKLEKPSDEEEHDT